VKIREVGESFYNPLIPKVISELSEKGLIKEDSGAQCIFRSIKPFPLIVQKSDGGFTYDSTDCAAIWYRTIVERADWIIYVVDSNQSEHFELIFDTAKAAGWLERSYSTENVRVDHVCFGVVQGADGKKIKTRSGDVIRLVDLLDEAEVRARKILHEKNKELTTEIDFMSKVIGTGAVKYADLKNNRLTNYVFSFDQMLNFKGNTAVYLEYTHARISKIVNTVVSEEDKRRLYDNIENEEIKLIHDSEIDLSVYLLQWPEVVLEAANKLTPHLVAEYLFELSVRFNAFYRDCQVIGSENQYSRIILCEAVSMLLRKGLQLLGITPLHEM
jgi:arginyl-tRNA synthetase